MRKQVSNGKCSFCDAIFSKAAMTKHLKSCNQRKAVSEISSTKRNLQKTKHFHLMVEGRDLPNYWMHLSVATNTTLEELDGFLRNIWLECCGHLSAFTIENVRYGQENDGIDSMWSMIFGRREVPKSMDIQLGLVLHPGLKFYHEYDFGTTTRLTLKVISELEEIKGKSIRLMARNEPPGIVCELCGEIATKVCSQCIYDGEGWLCNKCSKKHNCGEDMFLPVVNSPRVGMCGYIG